MVPIFQISQFGIPFRKAEGIRIPRASILISKADDCTVKLGDKEQIGVQEPFPATKATLKSLIEEQTGINEQAWKQVPPCLLSKLINEQGGIFRLLHEKLRAGWKENLKNPMLRD